MTDPIEILKKYDRWKYSKDAAGHEHDPANGQFTGTGGGTDETKPAKVPKGLTPHIDNILGGIQASGTPFPKGHQASSKDIAAMQKAVKMGWIQSISDPEKPGVVLGYELTELGKSVVGKSKSTEESAESGGLSGLLKQASSNAAAAAARKRAGF